MKPIEYGKTGRSTFFVGPWGTPILRSRNDERRRGGLGRINPDIAFIGTGTGASVAIGTRGADGDLWEVVE